MRNEIWKKMWKPRELDPKQYEEAQDAAERWRLIGEMTKTAGWKIFIDDIEKEFRKADTLEGISLENIDHKLGYREGINFALSRIPHYQTAARSAEEILARFARPNGE